MDFYWCFCLKNQPRKYFWFGRHAGLLDKDYLDLMRRAAKIWTAADPCPTMELILALGSKDADVRACALRLLRKMRAKDLKDVAAKCTNAETRAPRRRLCVAHVHEHHDAEREQKQRQNDESNAFEGALARMLFAIEY